MKSGNIKDRLYLTSDVDQEDDEKMLGQLIFCKYKNFYVDKKTNERVYQFEMLLEDKEEKITLKELEEKEDWIRIEFGEE